MATLTGSKIKDTYDSLLKAEDNDVIGVNKKRITDGLGNVTSLELSQTEAKINGNFEVTGSVTASSFVGVENPNDATITLTAGAGVDGGGSFTTDQAINSEITISHSDTSSQSSITSSVNTFVDGVTLDDYGHVTGLTTQQVNIPDAVEAGANINILNENVVNLDNQIFLNFNNYTSPTFNVASKEIIEEVVTQFDYTWSNYTPPISNYFSVGANEMVVRMFGVSESEAYTFFNSRNTFVLSYCCGNFDYVQYTWEYEFVNAQDSYNGYVDVYFYNYTTPFDQQTNVPLGLYDENNDPYQLFEFRNILNVTQKKAVRINGISSNDVPSMYTPFGVIYKTSGQIVSYLSALTKGEPFQYFGDDFYDNVSVGDTLEVRTTQPFIQSSDRVSILTDGFSSEAGLEVSNQGVTLNSSYVGSKSSLRVVSNSIIATSDNFAVYAKNGFVAPTIHQSTTASSANVYVQSDGRLYRSTSSIKYKKDVEAYNKGLNELMQLEPKSYKSKVDDDNKTHAGFIAEELDKLGFSEFVHYDTKVVKEKNDKGEFVDVEKKVVENVYYDRITALLVNAIKDLKAEIEELKSQINS